MTKDYVTVKIHRAKDATHIVWKESSLYATNKRRKLKFTTVNIPLYEVKK